MEQVKYRPQLDGVRAFCIIFTIANHVEGLPTFINGSVGVDVFFALSGWLITHFLIVEQRNSGTISLSNFYIRRIFRIMPLYYITLGLYIVSTLATRDPVKLAEMVPALPYIATFSSEYRPSTTGNFFGQAWTLGIEEKFYLIWPAIMLMLGARPIRAAIAAIVCITLLLMLSSDVGQMEFLMRGYIGLGLGTAMAVLVERRPALGAWLERRPVGAIALALMVLPYLGSVLVARWTIWNIAMAALATPMIASIWLAPHQWLAKFFATCVLAWLGRLTYAIYLIHNLAKHAVVMALGKWHLPITGWPLFIATYAAAIGLAWGLHLTIERPMILFGRKLAKRVQERLPMGALPAAE